MPIFHDVCAIGDVPEGQARMFVLDETMISVFRIGDEYFALSDLCPHAGASLARGYIENDIVRCRIHHWRFCIKDGTYLDDERPAMNVRSYTVRLNGDRVQVAL